MSNQTLDLSRLMYDLEEGLVDVMVLQDYPNLRLDGINTSLIKAQEIKLPLWIADVLEEEDIVKIQLSELVSPRAIKQMLHQESENKGLNQVDSLLYRRVRAYISELKNKGTSSALRKLTSIEGSFDTLLRVRFRKILQYAIGGKLDKRGRNTLSAEEVWLFQNLNEIFTTFRSSAGLPSDLGEE